MRTKKTIPSELNHLPDVEIARRLGVSKQRIWQLRKEAGGHCIICSDYAEKGYDRCTIHREASNRSAREYVGCNEWAPGGKGRIPKWAK